LFLCCFFYIISISISSIFEKGIKEWKKGMKWNGIEVKLGRRKKRRKDETEAERVDVGQIIVIYQTRRDKLIDTYYRRSIERATHACTHGLWLRRGVSGHG